MAATAAESSARSRSTAVASTSLIEMYNRFFEVIQAQTAEQLRLVHELRYQVYCVENAFEDPAQHPNGLEIDQYDQRSVHTLLMYRPSGIAAGTMRLILSDQDKGFQSLPAVAASPALRSYCASLPAGATVVEISRFSISKQFRKRAEDTHIPAYYGRGEEGDSRRFIPHIALGLMVGLFENYQKLGFSHLCGIVEPAMIRLLEKIGAFFEPVGPKIEFHGQRQPIIISSVELLRRLKEANREIYDAVTHGQYSG